MTKVRFLNDVCLRQVMRPSSMLFASQMMSASPHGANITSLLATPLCIRITSCRLGDTSFKKEVSCGLKENKLIDLSMAFSVEIIELVKTLKEKHESIMSSQIGRSGTSIRANIHESQYAQGKRDFISKLEIALKEASETGYWLELLHRTGYIDDSVFQSLSSKCASLRVLLISSCKTAKANLTCE